MALLRSVLAAVAMTLLPLSHAWNVELPPCTEPFKPYVYSGCFQEGQNSNTLLFRSSLDSANMTGEMCMAECKGNGFRYAGLEYYGVCFCGATVDGTQIDESKCSFPCSGDKTQKCGGDRALSIWQDPTFPNAEGVTYDSYKSLGCYTDESSKGRTLSYPMDLGAVSCSPKTCLAACEKHGFPFAGIEYGNECYCGVVLANDTVKVDSSQCDVPCPGDSSNKCGGRSRLSLWIAKDLWSLEPCGQPPGMTTTTLSVITTTTKSTESATTRSVDTTTTKPADTTTIKYIESTTTKPADTTTSDCDETTPVSSQPFTTTKSASTTTKPAETTTSDCEETTPVSSQPLTTTKPASTTTKPADTTTSDCDETTPVSSQPFTTQKPTTTTKQMPSITTAWCTTTVTLPAKCEWQCGNWCAPALPQWHDSNSCNIAKKTCRKQISSCFKTAGWPGSVECYKFKAWCDYLDNYCEDSCPGRACGKTDCWNQYRGDRGSPPANPPITTTSVHACATTSQPAPTEPTVPCPPQDTNLCTQPTNDKYGYGPGKPVGGIALPVVGCNDQRDDFYGKPYKYYTEAESRNCPGFSWSQWPSVCSSACEEQYNNCVATYSKGCDTLGWKNKFHRRAEESDAEVSKRFGIGIGVGIGIGIGGGGSRGGSGGSGSHTCAVARVGLIGSWLRNGSDEPQCWGFDGNKPDYAIARCEAQYQDCQRVNQRVNPQQACSQWSGC
ncbi:hypothetical protein E4U21_006361 [Claviceps maximensis]|nr:hypothetical protein E4U21_006361 [Claviceps maximensis]